MRFFRRKRFTDDLATREANLVAQIHIYEALAKAMDRRQEVFDLLVESDDVEGAQSDLQALLAIDEVAAQAVMDLQLRRLPAVGRNRIMVALAEMQANLQQVRSDFGLDACGVGHAPNPRLAPRAVYETKVAAYRRRWPGLTADPWP